MSVHRMGGLLSAYGRTKGIKILKGRMSALIRTDFINIL